MIHLTQCNLHGAKLIKADAFDLGDDVAGVYITFIGSILEAEPELGDHQFMLTVFMPLDLAEAYASAINAVNDKGKEVEGEPVEVPEPVADEDKLEPLEWRV